jgi:AcrR family transcriptional regulator
MSTEQRNGEIVVAAARLFDTNGYANTTMDDIAAAVHIAKPTLYHYFRGKSDILRSIHEDFIEILISAYQQRIDAGAGPQALIHGAMRDILALMGTHRGYVRVFFEHHRDLSDEARHEVMSKRDHYEALVQSAVSAGASEHIFRATDPKLTSLAIFGMCNWAYQWYRPDGAHTPEELADTFWSFLVDGVAAAPGSPDPQVTNLRVLVDPHPH